MFGRNDGQSSSQNNSNDIPDESIHGVLDGEPAAEQTVIQPTGGQDNSWQHPGKPLSDISVSPPAPAAPAAPPLPAPTPAAPAPTPVDDTRSDRTAIPIGQAPSQDLMDIKQQALTQLSPLVSNLDQSPEEKFRTTMMMIQAGDDQSLVKSAYETAQQIPDDKARAQALLDIINEINYFTSQH